MTLDKLNRTEQISNMVEKVEKSSSILKRLTGKKWGTTTETINNSYHTYIKPILQYGDDHLIDQIETKIN